MVSKVVSGSSLALSAVTLAIALTFANHAVSEAESNVVALITEWEHAAAAADETKDVSFFKRNLSDDWTGGTSTGRFQDKNDLLSDLRDKTHFTMLHETLADMKVRVYGDTAIATYREIDDAVINGERRSTVMISTDTFARVRGEWKEVAEHSSEVPQP